MILQSGKEREDIGVVVAAAINANEKQHAVNMVVKKSTKGGEASNPDSRKRKHAGGEDSKEGSKKKGSKHID